MWVHSLSPSCSHTSHLFIQPSSRVCSGDQIKARVHYLRLIIWNGATFKWSLVKVAAFMRVSHEAAAEQFTSCFMALPPSVCSYVLQDINTITPLKRQQMFKAWTGGRKEGKWHQLNEMKCLMWWIIFKETRDPSTSDFWPSEKHLKRTLMFTSVLPLKSND